MAITRTGQAVFAITCGTSGAAIHYTIDGTNPTVSSPTYSAKVTTKKNITVKAIGVKSGMLDSLVADEEILVKLPAPTVNQSASGDTGSITLTNASVYEDYEGVTYQVAKDSGTFTVCTFPYAVSGNGTYKFKAVSAGENEDSDVTSITVSALRVDTPVITVDPE